MMGSNNIMDTIGFRIHHSLCVSSYLAGGE